MLKLSRRAILRGTAALVAAGLNARLLPGCTDEAPARPSGPRPIERKNLQFDLGDFPADLEYSLEVGNRVYSLRSHTNDTLTRARATDAILGAIPDDDLTHFVPEVELPADAPQSITISFQIPGSEMRELALAAIHVPEAGVQTAQAIKGESFGYLSFRRNQYGITKQTLQPLADDAGIESPTDLALLVNSYDVARYIVYHHPEILSLDKTVAAMVLHHLDSQTAALEALAAMVRRAGKARSADDPSRNTAWARGVYLLDPETQQKIPQLNEDGSPVLVNGQPAYQWYYAIAPTIQTTAGELIARTLEAIRDDADLENVRYHVEESRSTRAEPLPSPPPPQLQAGASAFKYLPVNERWDSGTCVSGVHSEGEGRTISFEVANSFNRTVGVFCGFFDQKGVLLGRSNIGGDGDDGIVAQQVGTSLLEFKGFLQPAPWLLGTPITGGVARARYRVRIPDSAASLGVFVGGLAFRDSMRAYDSRGDAAKIPMLLSIITEFGLPTVALAFGALLDAGNTLELKKELVLPGIQLGARLAANIYDQVTNGEANWVGTGVWLANTAIKLAMARAAFVSLWAGAVTAGNAVKGIPIAGTALFAIQALDTLSNITRTLVGLGQSNTVVTTEIRSTNALRVTIAPSDALGLPQTGTRWELQLVPQIRTTEKQSGAYSFLTNAAGFDVTFPAVPSGGKWTAITRIFSNTGFLVGYGAVEFEHKVVAGATEAAVTCKVENQAIPITKDTTYSISAQLESDGTKHTWVAPKAAPPGGLPDACIGGNNDIVCEPIAIGICAAIGQAGYAWNGADRALGLCDGTQGGAGTSLFTMRNINLNVFIDGGAPDGNIRDYGCGDFRPVIPLYPLRGSGAYVLEASSGKYVLRALTLSGLAPADFRKNPVLATFASRSIRAAAIFDEKYVMIVSGDAGADKLEVVAIPQGVGGPEPTIASIRSGPGKLRGNIKNATAVCQAYNADAFIVLEDGNKRLQAFGAAGSPATDFFVRKDGSKSAVLELPQDRRYLDVACELRSGTVYVLSRSGLSRNPNELLLEIYDPTTSTKLTTTPGFAAAKIALDNNQNILALGWNELTFRGRKEPGLWRWIPSTPGGA